MKLKLFATITAVAAIIATSTSSMRAVTPPPTLASAVQLAAEHHFATQGLQPNGDLGSGNYDCAWQWDIPGPAYQNTQGPSAQGLLAAYDALGLKKYLNGTTVHNGAICAALQMIARYDAAPANRAYAQDLVFLDGLSDRLPRKPVANLLYHQKAVAYHARTRAAYPTGALLADHYIDARFSLAPWDLTSQIQAALAVGQDDYAEDILDEIILRRSAWEGVLYGGFDYTGLSKGAILAVLDCIGGKTIRNFRKEILATVLAAQDPTDGSWGDGDFQTTAYVLMGLTSLNRSHDVSHAIRGGVNFLITTQAAGGGWSYPPENGEVNGEVLTALAGLVGNRKGNDDCDRSFGKKDHSGHVQCNVRPHHCDRD